MKKVISICLLVALAVMTAGPAIAADPVIIGAGTVGTGLTKGTGGVAPIVKAKWEMNGPWSAALGTSGVAQDDYPAIPNAQFDPSMKYQVNKVISICGVIYDQSLTDINAVYGDVYYPQISLGPNHPADRQGCSTRVGSECTMVKIAGEDHTANKNASWDLFCNKVRNGNTGVLPTFADSETFDTICSNDGWIKKDVAYVYCCDKNLSYEDPSGNYKVDVWSQSKTNATSDPLVNYFTYNDGTAFQTDFTNVAYGAVTLNNWVVAPGNVNFVNGDGRPTIRNVGNTRLAINVAQDDMGMGDRDLSPTSTAWNVHYKAKINTDGVYAPYEPFKKKATLGDHLDNQYQLLDKEIDLSTDDEIDFGVLVDKFEGSGPFSGTMWLKGTMADHLTCETIQP